MRIQSILVAFIAAFAICLPVRADELTPEKRASIEQLLTMTNSFAISKQMATTVASSMLQALKQARPDIPQKVVKLVPLEIAAVFDENIDGLKNDFVAMYHKNFTQAEIKELIKFYASDIGQKTIKVMPTLIQDGMVIGQRWGQSLGPQISQRVKSKLQQNGVQI